MFLVHYVVMATMYLACFATTTLILIIKLSYLFDYGWLKFTKYPQTVKICSARWTMDKRTSNCSGFPSSSQYSGIWQSSFRWKYSKLIHVVKILLIVDSLTPNRRAKSVSVNPKRRRTTTINYSSSKVSLACVCLAEEALACILDPLQFFFLSNAMQSR